jgi:ATP-dependent 26S proteasome regulatory subunit
MQMAQLVNLIEQKKDVLNVVVSGEKSKIEGALSTYPDFYPGVLSYRLVISDMSTVKIVQEIISELQKNYKLEEGFEPQLDNFVISKYSDSPLKSKAFIQSVVQTIIFNHYNKELNADDLLLVKDIPLANNRRSDEEIWRDFNALTGLETVKSEIHSVEQLLKFQKKLQSIGANTSGRPNMHMIFSGNPGTGKTTVARLIAEILYNVGFIKQNKFVEVSSKDLIGRYIGQTAPKTAAVCESAYGGVLFIDEAYELTVKGNSTGTDIFRSECISELIKQMEDNRDKLIVIFAGYTKEMQELIKSNAGFASRIGRIIEFEDYTTDQLVDIFTRLVYKNGMKISENAKQTLVNTIQSAKNVPDFGNARYIRNLYENTIMEHAKNMVNVDDVEALVEIQDIDIPAV